MDEIGHARLMGRLARASGAEPALPRFGPRPERDRVSLAVENAVQGCVGETFAALTAAHQARHATDGLRGVFARVARDEAEHARWSWDLDAWLRQGLSRAQRRRVEDARWRAIRALGCRVGDPPPGLAPLGLPTAGEARRAVSRLAALSRGEPPIRRPRRSDR